MSCVKNLKKIVENKKNTTSRAIYIFSPVKKLKKGKK